MCRACSTHAARRSHIIVVVLPVGLDVAEQSRLAEGGQDTGDIGVGAAGVAVGIVRAVTVIRPQTMNGP